MLRWRQDPLAGQKPSRSSEGLLIVGRLRTEDRLQNRRSGASTLNSRRLHFISFLIPVVLLFQRLRAHNQGNRNSLLDDIGDTHG
jgi:hypothetical protein